MFICSSKTGDESFSCTDASPLAGIALKKKKKKNAKNPWDTAVQTVRWFMLNVAALCPCCFEYTLFMWLKLYKKYFCNEFSALLFTFCYPLQVSAHSSATSGRQCHRCVPCNWGPSTNLTDKHNLCAVSLCWAASCWWNGLNKPTWSFWQSSFLTWLLQCAAGGLSLLVGKRNILTNT